MMNVQLFLKLIGKPYGFCPVRPCKVVMGHNSGLSENSTNSELVF